MWQNPQEIADFLKKSLIKNFIFCEVLKWSHLLGQYYLREFNEIYRAWSENREQKIFWEKLILGVSA